MTKEPDDTQKALELVKEARRLLASQGSFRVRTILDMVCLEIESERKRAEFTAASIANSNWVKAGLAVAGIIGVVVGIDGLDLLGIDFIA